MARRHTGRADKGSQLHFQDLVNDSQKRLNKSILNMCPSLKEQILGNPRWVSPLRPDYKEYRDREFLERLELGDYYSKLRDFWPRGGPVWDGLATIKSRDGSKGAIFIEAKSHIGEVQGPHYSCGAKSPTSLAKIGDSLDQVKDYLGIAKRTDWLHDIYQHANRIAHLYFLRERAKIPAWLVFVYFLGDKDQGGPETASGYDEVLKLTQTKLGLPDQHRLSRYIVRVFINL